MSYQGPKNEGRVRKCVEFLELLEKSATANGIGKANETEMLQPIFDKLAAMGYAIGSGAENPQPTAAPPIPSPGTKEPGWYSIRKAAIEAPLSDLVYAMAVLLSRLDDELNLNLKGKK